MHWLATCIKWSWHTICVLIMDLGSGCDTCAANVTILLQKHCKLGCCLCSEAVLAECNDGSCNDVRTASPHVAILTCCEIHSTQQQFTSAEYLCSSLSSGNHPDLAKGWNCATCHWTVILSQHRKMVVYARKYVQTTLLRTQIFGAWLRLSRFACKICVERHESKQTGVYADTRRAPGWLSKVCRVWSQLSYP